MTDRRSRAGGDEPAPGAGRQYNRRRAEDAPPNYFEAFERMAVALESIAAELARREVTLPPSPARPSARAPSRQP